MLSGEKEFPQKKAKKLSKFKLQQVAVISKVCQKKKKLFLQNNLKYPVNTPIKLQITSTLHFLELLHKKYTQVQQNMELTTKPVCLEQQTYTSQANVTSMP